MSRRAATVTVDDRDAELMLSRLNDRQTIRAVQAGAKKAGALVRRAVQDEVKQLHGSWRGTKTVKVRRRQHQVRALYQDVKLFAYRRTIGANVSLLNGKKWNRAYVLRFLNQGTTARFTRRKHAARGSLKAEGFFQRGVQRAEKQATGQMKAYVYEAVDKAYKRAGYRRPTK